MHPFSLLLPVHTNIDGEAPPALKGGASNHSTKDSGKSDAKVLESIRNHSLFGFKAIVILSQDLAAPASITGYQDLEVAVTIVISGKSEKATHANARETAFIHFPGRLSSGNRSQVVVQRCVVNLPDHPSTHFVPLRPVVCIPFIYYAVYGKLI